MQLNLKEPYEAPEDQFKVNLVFMIGDADGEMTETMSFPLEKEKELKCFLLACESLIKAYPSGRGGYETYDDFFLYQVFFGDLMCDIEDKLYDSSKNGNKLELTGLEQYALKLNPDFNYCEHPAEPNGDGIQCSFQRLYVSKIVNGVEYPIEIIYSPTEMEIFRLASSAYNGNYTSEPEEMFYFLDKFMEEL